MNKQAHYMLGDWVSTPRGNGKIEAINGWGVSVEANGTLYVFSYVHISPIPLTPDIMEKNGFEWDGGQIWSLSWKDNDGTHKMRFRSMYDKQNNCWGCLGVMIGNEVQLVESVSEMQQLLRLCGLDEMADNLTIE